MSSLLSERLRYIRESQDKIQQDVADFLGITRPAYCSYETGRRRPDHTTIAKLATFFHVSTDYLLGNSDIADTPSQNTQLAPDPLLMKFTHSFQSSPTLLSTDTTHEIGDRFVNYVITQLESYGLCVIEKTPLTRDYGIDIIFITPFGRKIGIECRHGCINTDVIQSAYAGARYHDCDEAWIFVNNQGEYTKRATKYARKIGVHLVDQSNFAQVFVNCHGVHGENEKLPIMQYRLLNILDEKCIQHHKGESSILIVEIEECSTVQEILQGTGRVFSTILPIESALVQILFQFQSKPLNYLHFYFDEVKTGKREWLFTDLLFSSQI